MQIKTTSNAGKLAIKYRKRTAGMSRALRRGLKRAAIAIDNKQADLLSGGSEAGDYPIPVRNSGLFQGHDWDMQGRNMAIVFNTASYALVIHEGKGSSKAYGRRPFLDDAVDAVDYPDIIQREVRKAIFA